MQEFYKTGTKSPQTQRIRSKMFLCIFIIIRNVEQNGATDKTQCFFFFYKKSETLILTFMVSL